MRLFAIGDLHLPGGTHKPMDVFGLHWVDHWKRISDDWRAAVDHDDIVLIPGDISWAMSLEGALPDLRAIGSMPGHKIIIRGNHDYWWSGITKVRTSLPPKMYAIQNDAVDMGVVVCGTRGWIMADEHSDPNDRRIYCRELQRLEMSLIDARKKKPRGRLIVMAHYPPVDGYGNPSAVSELIERYDASDVVYGHLHGSRLKNAFFGMIHSVYYHQVSCDRLDFRLYPMP